MILFAIVCLLSFYLLTARDSIKVKQVVWPVYGIIGLACIISLFTLNSDTATYVFWVRVFFLLLAVPVLSLVIRKVWQLSSGTSNWISYTVTIPVSFLFVLTLWLCWNMFPILLYIF
ncbi:hypothetical protein [Fictibacillus phosphorivorans]|uniref:hypothetical protein n=1 Tax=Fictibacillus phosphorivorans TaxID=1221500 RepID=UPI000A8684C1|nr:hypothetical protein [Fictibacillus phosphorivorans]